ncbi:MAG TPA: fructosamine kinase family protein, partial [Chitinophagaceae bacterium]|nr:fructosamine kinase family protein [Chitinophagaceae bacterium]
MLPPSLYEDLKKLLSQHYAKPIEKIFIQPISGGSINQTYKLIFSNTHAVFCKLNKAAAFPDMFLKEQNGLNALHQTACIKTPDVIAHAVLDQYQVLLLEWIESGPTSPAFFKTFGRQLAALHQNTHPAFGWHEANYMGSVPQQNSFSRSWTDFLIHQRLEPLAQKCVAKTLLTPTEYGLLKKLYTKLPLFFDDGEKPALLHGDLWSGNFMCTKNNEPVLIDPAIYYGHRSMDLA